jgi:hypothetical protein
VAFYGVHARRDQDRCGDITSVASTLTGLGTDDIDADVKRLLDVLRMANHVHYGDASFVKSVDNLLWGNANGGDKKPCSLFDDYLNESRELAPSVVVLLKMGSQ